MTLSSNLPDRILMYWWYYWPQNQLLLWFGRHLRPARMLCSPWIEIWEWKKWCLPYFRETPWPQTWTARNIMNGSQRRGGRQLFESDPYFAICEIDFVNVRESALFRAGAPLQKCQKSYLQEMCAWLCYIKCVIGVIPNHMHCPQLLPCVFSLSLPWSFYTLPSLVKLYSEKWLPHLGIACLGVGGGVVNVFLDGCEQFCSFWSEHFLDFSL